MLQGIPAKWRLYRRQGYCIQDPKGLTLIELLVVIGIIMVLAGIIYAVFSTVRNRAIETICISNLHQIGIAMEMYLEDYKTFPAWPGGLLAYTQNLQIFLCPSDPEPTYPNFGPSEHQMIYHSSYRFDTLPTNGLWDMEPPEYRQRLWEIYYRHPLDYPTAYDRVHWEVANRSQSWFSQSHAPVFILRADGRVSRLMRQANRSLAVNDVLELSVGEGF